MCALWNQICYIQVSIVALERIKILYVDRDTKEISNCKASLHLRRDKVILQNYYCNKFLLCWFYLSVVSQRVKNDDTTYPSDDVIFNARYELAESY